MLNLIIDELKYTISILYFVFLLFYFFIFYTSLNRSILVYFLLVFFKFLFTFENQFFFINGGYNAVLYCIDFRPFHVGHYKSVKTYLHDSKCIRYNFSNFLILKQ